MSYDFKSSLKYLIIKVPRATLPMWYTIKFLIDKQIGLCSDRLSRVKYHFATELATIRAWQPNINSVIQIKATNW